MLLSPPTVNHWESIISLSVLRQNGQGGVLLFLPLFFLSLILGTFGIWPISKVTQWLQLQSRSAKTQRVQPAQAHYHSFSLFVSVAFPATPGCMGRGGEGSGVTPGMKKGWVFWASRQMPALFKSAQWVRPNCLHVLLTPSELQTSKQRHKDKGKRGPRALPHKYICSPDTAECEVFTSPNETDLNHVIMNVTGILLRLFTDMKCSISASCEAL